MPAGDRMAHLMLRDGQKWFIFNWQFTPDRKAFQPGDGIAERAWWLLRDHAVSASQDRDCMLYSEGRRKPEMVRFNTDNVLWVKGDQ